jgi:4-carboxymuconolactone decarboxylase
LVDTPNAARFKALRPEEFTEEQQRVAEALVQGPRGTVRGPYIPLMYSPELADRIRHLSDFIRFEGALSPRLKEIVIFVTARHWSVDYMFGIHRLSYPQFGLDPAIPDAIAEGRRPDGLAPEEEVAIDVAEQLLTGCQVDDATFAAAHRHFGEQGTIELVTFVGYYTTLAMILNAARLPAPAGTEPLPRLAPKAP